ncbi:unnamed protein product, partial [Symbiodinium microadriaticum]
MDAISVGAALGILEASSDSELAPALLQRPDLTQRLRALVGTAPPRTAPASASPSTASACAGHEPAAPQTAPQPHAPPSVPQGAPQTAVPAFGGGTVYVHALPTWSVPNPPPQEQSTASSFRPDPWEEHWRNAPRTDWADLFDEDSGWQRKGQRPHGKGGRSKGHYDDYDERRAPQPHANSWGKGAAEPWEHQPAQQREPWEMGGTAPQEPAPPPVEMKPSTQIRTEIRWSRQGSTAGTFSARLAQPWHLFSQTRMPIIAQVHSIDKAPPRVAVKRPQTAPMHAQAATTTQRAMPLSPAPVREQAPTTTKARNAAARKLAEQTFIDLANRIGPACEAFLQLSASANFASHLRRLVAPFAVSTLQRYLRASHVIVDFISTTSSQSGKPCLSNIKVSLMADYMLACSASKEEDREVHMMSPASSIKALRWVAKTLQWQALSDALSSPVISAYGKQSREYDRKEATPIPMALLAGWERTICSAEAPLTTKLFLGAVLLCTHASLRFGDAQRIEWTTLQLSAQGLHGTAYATKATKCGQPFACTWHGITGRCVQSSWLLQWLCLVEVGTEADLEPDFLFFHADLDSHKHPQVFPCSYAHALLCLRFMAQKAGLAESEACALTLHSMKSTMLAAAAQIQFDEHARLAQGHHRDSLRLYSRNDTLEALRLQRELSTQLARGWRPQRSMARGGAAPVPEPPFSTPPQPPQQLLDNEQGQFSHLDMKAYTDSEAELVEKYAREHTQSSEEESEEPTAPAPDEELFVCSGPWNALHSPTRSSHLEYELLYGSNPMHANVLIAACGADLGSMPVVIKTHVTTTPGGMAAQSGADVPGGAPHSAHDELNNDEGLQRILRELCVPPAMHQALRAQGICCIADFAYAYNSTADLDNFAASKDEEFWTALQVTEQPLHSMPMARLRRALVQAQIRLKAYEAQRLRTEEPAPQSSAPSSSTAPPADSWVEHAPQRLDNDTVAKLTAEFKEAYPGELLDSASTPSIRLLSMVYAWFKDPAQPRIKYIPWQFRMSQRQYTEIIEAKAHRIVRTEDPAEAHKLLQLAYSGLVGLLWRDALEEIQDEDIQQHLLDITKAVMETAGHFFVTLPAHPPDSWRALLQESNAHCWQLPGTKISPQAAADLAALVVSPGPFKQRRPAVCDGAGLNSAADKSVPQGNTKLQALSEQWIQSNSNASPASHTKYYTRDAKAKNARRYRK